MDNIDKKTVSSFGDEWTKFNQADVSYEELDSIFRDYFRIFPWGQIPVNAEGFDMGCGSGRWAQFVAPRVGKLNCIEPSSAINIARLNLKDFKNICFFNDSADGEHITPETQDFGYSLGVLHHVPNTELALKKCVSLLKPGAPFLVYLYYKLDDRPFYYRALWYVSDFFRKHMISRMPSILKGFISDLIALLVYFPISRISLLFKIIGYDAKNIPLSYYSKSSLYTMRTDARDRFGTPLEKRFSKKEIHQMLVSSGLTNIRFSDEAPYWCALGIKERRV